MWTVEACAKCGLKLLKYVLSVTQTVEACVKCGLKLLKLVLSCDSNCLESSF